jgi:hypothetical protein
VKLLMLHGMADKHVEYKDVRLSQRFIKLRQNWSLSSFPVEVCGFKETVLMSSNINLI